MSDETSGATEEGDTADGITDRELEGILESLMLVVDSPVAAKTLADVLEVTETRVTSRLRAMSQAMADRNSGFDLRFVGDGWRLFTRIEYAGYVERLLLDGSRSTLTRAALETLAVVAYRQPVTRARVSAVRGVNVDGVMRTLLARGLITEAGADPDSHGIMYSTTEMFLERLGLASLADLPALAPLLPDEDVIEYISENLDSEPRMRKLNTRGSNSEPGDEPTENDVNSSE